MISLCPRCHAKVERTQMVLSEMDPVLLELWREKHPQGLEQFALDFEKCNESCPYTNLLKCLGGLLWTSPQLDALVRGEEARPSS